MKVYHEDNILLQDAMTKELPSNPEVRFWNIPGLHVEALIPDSVQIEKTFVRKSRTNTFFLGVEWTMEGDLGDYIGVVAEFSSLEKLKDNFPKIFEVKGELFAF